MAAAARAGLGEQSHSPAAQTPGSRLKEMERRAAGRDSAVSEVCRLLSRCGVRTGRGGPSGFAEVPEAPGRGYFKSI